MDCTGSYWAALGCTGLYWEILGCTGLYWEILGCTGLYWAVVGYTWLYWAVLGCIGLRWAVLVCTGLYWSVLGCNELYCTVLRCASYSWINSSRKLGIWQRINMEGPIHIAHIQGKLVYEGSFKGKKTTFNMLLSFLLQETQFSDFQLLTFPASSSFWSLKEKRPLL